MEIWKGVLGVEKYFEVSSEGRVRSLDRLVPTGTGYRLSVGKVLKPYLTKLGYYEISLTLHNKTIRNTIHSLVGRTFLGEGLIHHVDGNKLNNKLSNLIIMTRSEHISHHLHNPTKLLGQ